jgi:hypothetical protein
MTTDDKDKKIAELEKEISELRNIAQEGGICVKDIPRPNSPCSCFDCFLVKKEQLGVCIICGNKGEIVKISSRQTKREPCPKCRSK